MTYTIIPITGLQGGADEFGFSTGVNVLATKIREAIDIPGTQQWMSRHYTTTDEIIAQLEASKDLVPILIGHSLGVNTAVDVSRAIYPRKVPLLVALDASFWRWPADIYSNVTVLADAIGMSWLSICGHAWVNPVAGNAKTKCYYQRSWRGHTGIDDSSAIYDFVLSHLQEALQ